MNRKGDISVLVTLMLAMLIIVLALALAPVLSQNSLGIRGENNTLLQSWDSSDTGVTPGMNCDSPSSDFLEAGCVVSDLLTPTFLAILIGLAGLVIGAKVVFAN